MSSDAPQPNNNRWRLNSSGQLVDSEAESAAWSLSDDMVRLKIANGSRDDLDGHIRTPPQAKGAVASLMQHQESSPLETASDASLDSGSSPHTSDQHLALPTHVRGSSADSTTSSNSPQPAQQPSALGLKVGGDSREQRDRPHSYSGGLSAADLRRLQNAGGSEADQGRPSGLKQERHGQAQQEQPTYPSLASYPRQQGTPDDLQVDYVTQQRQFQPIVDTRVNGGAPSYRSPPPRGFNPQQVPGIPGNANVAAYMQPNHGTHLSLGTGQQIFDMMLPAHENPAVARVQQQHNVFRGSHQHSASDPLHLREAAALLNGGIPPFAPGMYPVAGPTMGMYPGQFYPQEAYPANVAAQVMAAARMQSQYPTPYGMGIPTQQQNLSRSVGSSSPTSMSNLIVDPNGNGPSANNRKLGLYKTELCRSWEEKGTCRYGPKCQFAHGEDEIRKVSRHPKYKTEICRTFWVSGSCPYGKRCCFIHTELPASGAPPGADGAPPPKVTETRGRSDSDSNEVPVSLLARISAKRNQDTASNGSSGGETTPSASYPPSNVPSRQTLRVDTSSLDAPAMKHQNKSAYPSFAPNGVLFAANENSGNRSPGPVTAGPDLGSRQRTEFAAYGQPKKGHSKHSSNSSVRHSFNGTEVNLALNTPSTASGTSTPFTPTPEATTTSRPAGHARSGSAGNWGNLSRSVAFHGPQTAAPGNEAKANIPWLAADASSNARYAEKAW
ncbi:hypothetical protein OF83DRAFT_1167685 [Amylostereum chailletii]|nr:hypothetical protein OF83DRAFT_1167685 [Amylostereum chailletii]